MAKKGFRIMDSDMHCMEPPDLWERYIDAPFKARAPRGAREQVLDATYLIDGKRMPYSGNGAPARPRSSGMRQRMIEEIRPVYERGWPAEAQLEAMDREGVDVAVVFPTVGLYALALDEIEPDFATAIARAYNNWLYDYCQANPRRLIGAAMLAPHDAEAAAKEARRAAQDLGFRGTFIRPNPVHGRNWYDPYYEPLWSDLEELDIPLAFHEGQGGLLPGATDRFLTNSFLRHVSCHPIEAMLALQSMCGGGVLARHPRLRVAYFEANCGWVPWLLDRLDDHYELEWGVTPEDLPQPPSAYFKRQCVVTAESDERFVKQVIAYLGDGNIVYSTDWPHLDSKYPHAVDSFLENDISDESKRKILWDNCARHYGIEVESRTAVPGAARRE